MADLRVEDALLAKVQAAFRAGASRLGPVIWAVKGLNGEVVGADPFVQRLCDADDALAAELGILGQAMTGGRRFRQTVEDLIEFLVTEKLASGRARWKAHVDKGRQGFEERQLRAAVRRHPDTALAILREEGRIPSA